MLVHISLSNSKLGDKVPTLNLPPIITCRRNAPCAKLCYARRGTHLYPNVKKSHMDNYNAYNADKVAFFDEVIKYLNDDDVTYKYFRWHSSGDIVDEQYLDGMVRVALSCPQTMFLAFTKKWELVNEWIDKHGIENLPVNLKIVLSMWDEKYNKTVKNKYLLPVTYVEFKESSEFKANVPTGGYQCPGSCKTCKNCWKMMLGQMTFFHQH